MSGDFEHIFARMADRAVAQPDAPPPRGAISKREVVLGYVAAHPGCKAVQIGRTLGNSFCLSIYELVTVGKLRHEGAYKFYRYYVTDEE